MRLTVVTSVVALAVLAAAVPQPVDQRMGMSIPITEYSQLVNANKSINLQAFDRHVAWVKAKIRRGLDNYQNNTGMDHPAAGRRVGKRANTVSLTDDVLNSWYGTIYVGSPEQKFTVVFDTGIADLFIPFFDCETCVGHTLWNPELSSTARYLKRTCRIRFPDEASVFNYVYTDTVSVAGLTAFPQTFGAALSYSPQFHIDEFKADGMMGMGFRSISHCGDIPVFQTLVSLGQVAEPVFSFKFSNPGAELYIGGSNRDLYIGSFTYVHVTAEGFWQVIMDDVYGDNDVISKDVAAIFDTGSKLILAPHKALLELQKTAGGEIYDNGRYTFSCNYIPTVAFRFGGTTFPIAPSSLNLGPVQDGSDECLSSLAFHYEAFWDIGTAFLQDLYTVFDVGNSLVGFAQLA